MYLILGATGGIGSALTRRLAGTARLVLAARDEAALDRVRQATPDSHGYVLDATSFEEVDACFAAARELGDGRLEGAALCVGSLLLRPAHLTSSEEWQSILATNLTSAFAVVRAAGKHMRDGGSVVLFSSAAAGIGLANHEAIAAAKAGVEGLVRAAAATHAARGLRFNAVAPALVRTGLAAPITSNPASLRATEELLPLGRIGTAEEVADLAAWLLSAGSSWMTGEVLRLDGGLARVRPTARAPRKAGG